MESSETVKKLSEEFQKLPGIGRKTAERLVFALLKSKNGMATTLAKALLDLVEKVKLCTVCGGITETEPCAICSSDKRDKTLVCVVEQPLDIAVLERTGKYQGAYHVLGGTLSPLDGVGPESLRIEQLIKRVKEGKILEVIVATNPTMDGEATALYLSRVLRPLGCRISRIARGVPVGSDLEYVDEITLTKSLEGRREM
ncbi:MAG: recombination protein RecR [Nitrospinae bacterium]|nr:recombination protein RecR [Nitrospinota bacterium]